MGTTKRKQKPLTGRVEVVGDKSITHRALVLAALAEGTTRLSNVNDGTDCSATAAAVEAFGAECRRDDIGAIAVVRSRGHGGLYEPRDLVDCGNSGTTLRMLAGVAAGIGGVTILTGDESLRRRPMLRVVSPLRQMGAIIDGREHGDRAPLAIRGGSLQGLDYSQPAASAQVRTCLLLAGLYAAGPTSVDSPGPSRDHTERLLRVAGAQVEVEGSRVTLTPGADLQPVDRTVPGDLSAALFFIAGALMVPGSDLTIAEVGLNPTRTGALDVLKEMGGNIEVTVEREDGGEPVGTVRARHSALAAFTMGPADVANCIDEIPILALVATRSQGRSEIRGAAELRVKESDRIRTITDGLRVLGASVEEFDDGIAVTGPTPAGGGTIDPRGDHRIAMMGAVGGLVSDGNVKVSGWSCVETSFPGFLDVLGRAQGRRG